MYLSGPKAGTIYGVPPKLQGSASIPRSTWNIPFLVRDKVGHSAYGSVSIRYVPGP